MSDTTGVTTDSRPAPVSWECVDTCGTCGSRAWRTEFTIHGRRYGRCQQCHVVRLVDRVAECDVGALYDGYYPRASPVGEAFERELANPTFASRRRHIESALGTLPRRLFEVGCGDGNFLVTMKRAGWEVAGSEHGATARMTAERHQIPVTSADVIRGDVPGAPFSVVAAYHVFEHIYRPAEWLRQVHEMVLPGGLLHLQVPNYASLTRPLGGQGWASWRFPQHVYFYTPETLAGVLGRFGFTVEHGTTWDPWHGPGTAVDSLAHRLRAMVGGPSPWQPDVRRRPMRSPAEAAEPTAPSAPPIARSALGVLGRAFSHVEAAVGRGAVVDVVARRH